MLKYLSAFLVAASVSTYGTHAAANADATTACGPRDSIVEHLAKKYGETPSGTGLGGATAIVEIWTSAESGSWTILMTGANGTSCILASGQDWQDMPEGAYTPAEPV